MSIDENRHESADNTEKPARFIGQDTVSGYLTYEIFQPSVSARIQATKQVGKDRQRTVLGALAVHADFSGVAKVSQLRLAQDLDIDRRDIRNCLDALEQAGLIQLLREGGKGRPSHYAVLPDFVENLKTRPQHAGQHGGQHAGQHAGHARHKIEIEIETPPPAKNSRTQVKGDLTPTGQEVMRTLLDRADYTGAQNYEAVRAKKRRDYLPIVKAWEQEQPQGDPVDWCLQRLQPTGGTPKPVTTYHAATYSHLKDNKCPHGCRGAGDFIVKENGRDVGFTNCVCRGGTVSLSGQTPHTPTDPQQATDKDPVKELRTRLRAG